MAKHIAVDEWEQYATPVATKDDEWEQYATPTQEPEAVAPVVTQEQTLEEMKSEARKQAANEMITAAGQIGDLVLDIPAMALQAATTVGSLYKGAGKTAVNIAADIAGFEHPFEAQTSEDIARQARQEGKAAVEAVSQVPVLGWVIHPASKIAETVAEPQETFIGSEIDHVMKSARSATEAAGLPPEMSAAVFEIATAGTLTKGAQVGVSKIAGKSKGKQAAEAVDDVLKDIEQTYTPEAELAKVEKAKPVNEDTIRNADTTAYNLLSEGASPERVMIAVKRNPEVKKSLERMEAARQNAIGVKSKFEEGIHQFGKDLYRAETGKKPLVGEGVDWLEQYTDFDKNHILKDVPPKVINAGPAAIAGHILERLKSGNVNVVQLYQRYNHNTAYSPLTLALADKMDAFIRSKPKLLESYRYQTIRSIEESLKKIEPQYKEPPSAYSRFTKAEIEAERAAEAQQFGKLIEQMDQEAAGKTPVTPRTLEDLLKDEGFRRRETEFSEQAARESIRKLEIEEKYGPRFEEATAKRKAAEEEAAYLARAMSTGPTTPTAISEAFKRAKGRKMGGKADPRLVAAIAGAGIGASVASIIAEDNSIANAMRGALAGFTLPYIRNVAGALKPTKLLQPLSTTLHKVAPRIAFAARRNEKNVLRNTNVRFRDAKQFIDAFGKLDDGVRNKLDELLLDNKMDQVRAYIAKSGNKELQVGWKKVDNIIATMGKELKDHGIVKNLRNNYFPRIVRDRDGLLKALEVNERSALEKKLVEAGTNLSDLQATEIINAHIRARGKGEAGRGFTKGRVLEDVPPELRKYYDAPMDSLLEYIASATETIETARFFGKHAKLRKGETLDALGAFDLESSLGSYMSELRKSDAMSVRKLESIENALRARFEPQGPMNAAIRVAKDGAYIGLLANFIAATNQLTDLAGSMARYGVYNSIKGMAEHVRGKGVDLDEVGVTHRIAEELSTTTKVHFFMDKMYTASGFKGLDKLSAAANVNASLRKFKSMSKTADGIRMLQKKFGEELGPEFPQLIKDLRTGRDTELVNTVLFSEISDIRPTSRLELPEAYNRNPNGRILYMLKSWTLKQIDYMHKKGIHEIAKGNIKEGTMNMARFATFLAICGTPPVLIKEWIFGYPPQPMMESIADNVLKTFGWSKYAADKIKQGKIGEGVISLASPPYKMYEDLIVARPEAIRYLPGVGPIAYEHTIKAKKRSEQEMKKFGLGSVVTSRDKFMQNNLRGMVPSENRYGR